MTRYRLVVLPLRTPKGPWRDTAKAARADALACELGWRDEHEPKRIYLHPLAAIETAEP